MDKELWTLLNDARSALLSASGTYKLLKDLGMTTSLPGLNHTNENNTKVLDAINNYIKEKSA